MKTQNEYKKIYQSALLCAKYLICGSSPGQFEYNSIDCEISKEDGYQYSVKGSYYADNQDETGSWRIDDVDFNITSFELVFISDEIAYEINEDGTTRELWEPFPLFYELGKMLNPNN